MKLNTEEANLFFELTWSLQFYVNQKKKIVPSVHTVNDYSELPQEEKFLVRSVLYESPEIIDDYVIENPDKLNEDKLIIVNQWKNFIKGDFYIERYLKNYAIFIGGENKVYGVVSLHQGFDEIFPSNYLPMYVKAILLPFKDKIVYDGLMQSYNMYFGGGIKRSIKETYMRAKQNDNVIFVIGKGQKARNNKTANSKSIDWSKDLEQMKSIAKKFKGGVDQPAINGPIFGLLKASIALANQAVVNSTDIDSLEQELRKVERATNKAKTVLYRCE